MAIFVCILLIYKAIYFKTQFFLKRLIKLIVAVKLIFFDLSDYTNLQATYLFATASVLIATTL